MPKTTSTLPNVDRINHRRGCPAQRFEQMHADRPDIVRCMDCGVQSVDPPAVSGALYRSGDDSAVTMRPAGRTDYPMDAA